MYTIYHHSLISFGRDVYAEFLDHPQGVCSVVGPGDGGCLCGASDCGRVVDRDDDDGIVRALADEKASKWREWGGYLVKLFSFGV